jgi:hypothetical protein
VKLQDVVVATVTWARSDDEAECLLRSLDSLRRVGLHVVVADRGGHPQFLRRLASLHGLAVSVAPAPGLVAQVQDAMARAGTLGTRFILYTEPDKLLFFETGLRDFLARAPAGDDIGAVLAARSAESLGTFPRVQRYTERVFNILAAEQIGTSGDYCYGPFLMHHTLLAAVTGLPHHLGWGWRPATLVAARRRAHRIVHLEGDYDCPPDQRHENETERIYRIRQLSENLLGLAS